MMFDYKFYELPFPHIIIDNFYNEEELSEIWKELEFLSRPGVLSPPEETGSASSEDGEFLKQNNGTFLYNFYSNSSISPILKYYRKFYDQGFLEEIGRKHFIFGYIKECNSDDVLLNYYEESDYYKPHKDRAVLTSVYNLYKEPKKFEGGDFSFSEYAYKPIFKNNSMILFPSIIEHSVEPIKMLESKEKCSTYGRYSIANFISFRGQ